MTKLPWVDPELAEFQGDGPVLDAQTLPKLREAANAARRGAPTFPDVEVDERFVPGPPGAPAVRVLRYHPVATPAPLPALLWLHGGQLRYGKCQQRDVAVKELVTRVGCAVISVDYRLAPETPFPGSVEDAYAALKWLQKNAPDLGIDAARLAVGGPSSGGGLSAALALLARDRAEVPVMFQLLLYPMLDDRTVTDPNPNPYTQKWDGFNFGWTSLLGHPPGQEGVSPYAVPARAEALAGLPPAFIAVGALDLFLDESLEYARRLLRAGVPTELHVYPGAYHAFDTRGKEAAVSRNFTRDWTTALQRALRLS